MFDHRGFSHPNTQARDWAGKQRAAAKLADDVARKETVLSDERVKHVVDATSRRGGRPSSAAAVAGEAGADDGDGETVFDEYRNDVRTLPGWLAGWLAGERG